MSGLTPLSAATVAARPAAFNPTAPLTPQQVFDNALFGIRNQGYKRSALSSGCLYRLTIEATGEVLKCGIGHSIPDEVCTSEWLFRYNGAGITGLVTEGDNPSLEALFRRVPRMLLGELQNAHDRNDTRTGLSWRDSFEREMQHIAARYGLIYNIPVQEPDHATA